LTKEDITHPLQFSLFTRMLFSCLIDADRLESAAFKYGVDAATLIAPTVSLSALRESLDEHPSHIIAESRFPAAGLLRECLDEHLSRFPPEPTLIVNQVRAELLVACRSAAAQPPGLFSLTAPTGSGKTLSSMAFALAHAERHGLRRVIYALPFTSVTEQVADVFRRVFGGLGRYIVLEHHSAAAQPKGDSSTTRDGEPETPDENDRSRRLFIENWDAPIVVTTSVQLLDSLFAANASSCRKLHRLAKSVIVLDEAQALNVDLLRPTLAAFKELTANYGTSIVLCTATMPAITHRTEFCIGLKNVREIVPDPPAMARALRRTEVRRVGKLDDAELVRRIVSAPQVLTIVNTRPHAAALFKSVREQAEGVLHLSAQMCPAHRSQCVDKIKSMLHPLGQPCRVISTQVVEAGIDIDFPIVYRAMAGLDSIAQAAGRCNREGGLPIGEVYVFDTDVKPPSGLLQAVDAARQVLAVYPGERDPDPLDLDLMRRYFELLYWSKGGPSPTWDGPVGPDGHRRDGGITGLLKGFLPQFRKAAALYNVISEESHSVVVPFGSEGTELCQKLLEAHTLAYGPARDLLRSAQRYTVSLKLDAFDKLKGSGALLESDFGPWVLKLKNFYDLDTGLRIDTLALIE